MPVATQRKGAHFGDLESGLKRLKTSKLMGMPEFATMYSTIEKHHRNFKLGSLTGMPSDIRRQAEQDSKFYYILAKMLGEVNSGSEQGQRSNVTHVYNWYEQNLHVLRSTPRFGRAKTATEKTTSRARSQGSAKERTTSAKSRNSETSSGSGSVASSPSVDQHSEQSLPGTSDHSDLLSGDATGLRPNSAPGAGEQPRPGPSHDPRPQTAQTQSTDEAPTPNTALGGGRLASTTSTEHLLPRRRPHPLPHVFNPLSKAFEATVQLPDQLSTDRASSASRFNQAAQGGGREPGGSVHSLRMTNLQKWESFQHQSNIGQAMLGKLQHIGRAGVPGSQRYAAHEKGLAAEDLTRDVIMNYALMDEYQKLQRVSPDSSGRRPLLEQPLEDFYQTTDPYYPVTKTKYPSFRGKSAPPSGKARQPSSSKENRAICSTMSLGSAPESGCESSVKLDAVVHMIDTITDEMTYHKEKLVPDPIPGFRHPIIPVDISSRPHTAPPGARGRPTSPSEEAKSDMYLFNQVAPGRDKLLFKAASEGANSRAGSETGASPQPMLDTADWRGKITPGTGRSKWSQGSFGTHSYVKKMSRPKSSLRTAGSHTPVSGDRPKTQSATIEELCNSETHTSMNKRAAVAASHTTMEVDPNVVSSLLTTTRFHSGKIRPRPQMDKEDYMDMSAFDFESYERPWISTTNRKEYVNICTSMKGIKELRATTGGNALCHEIAGECVSGRPHNVSVDRQIQEEPEVMRGTTLGGAPVVTDTRKFLEEVQRLVSSGAVEASSEDEVDEGTKPSQGHPDSPRSNDALTPAPAEVSQGSKGELSVCVSSVVNVDGTPPTNTDSQPAPAPEQGIHAEGHFGLSPDETDVINADIDEYLRQYDPSSQTSGITSRQHVLLANAYKQRVFQHAFPRPPRQNLHDDTGKVQESLTIEGRARRSKLKSRSRAAGTVPARAKSVTPARVLQKQSEMLKRSSVDAYRTAPSIPSPWSQYGTRASSTRPHTNVYMAELEAHSRKVDKPRHFVERVTDLRRSENSKDDNATGLTPEEMKGGQRHLVEPFKVFQMKHESGEVITISTGTPGDKLQEDPRGGPPNHEDTSDAPCAACAEEQRSAFHQVPMEYAGQRLLDMGRPIPQYLPAEDPVEVAAAVQRQKEAQAVVDIQRIFRGYVARNQYKFLQKEERQKREDKQKAAVEIQRTYRGHLARKQSIAKREPNPDTIEWARNYRQVLEQQQKKREAKAASVMEMNARENAKAGAKLSIIGPHVEVYEPFHPKRTGPDKALLRRAATVIQRLTRGWLIRNKFDKLRRKSKYHASSWIKFMVNYRELLRRIQMRLGVDKPQTPFNFKDISDYMDLKKRYESVFEKRAFGGEMDLEEMPEFFKECDLYPALNEIEEAIDSVLRGQMFKKSRGLFKHEVLEVTFQIYPPRGTGILSHRMSTWLNPIIDGEEAVKLSGTDNVEPTDFKTCWKLVSGTAKSRREEQAQAKRAAEEEQERIEDEKRRAMMKVKKKPEQKANIVVKEITEVVAYPPDGATKTPAATIDNKTLDGDTEVLTPTLEESDVPEGVVNEQGDEDAESSACQTDINTECPGQTQSVPDEDKTFIERKLDVIVAEAPEWIPNRTSTTSVPLSNEPEK